MTDSVAFAKDYCERYNNPSWDIFKIAMDDGLELSMLTPCLMFGRIGDELYFAFFDVSKCTTAAMMRETKRMYMREIGKYRLSDGFKAHARFERYFACVAQ